MATIGGLGSTPFGMGTPVSGVSAPASPSQLSRYLNPGSRDWKVDAATGQFAQMPPVRQRMELIMLTVVGSSSVIRTMGIPRPRKIDQYAETRMRRSVELAYAQLTDVEQVARIDAIDIERGNTTGRLTVTIEWRDLTQPNQVQTPITGAF